MSLRDGLEGLGRRNEHTVCGVARFKEQFPELAVELEELLAESWDPDGPSVKSIERRVHLPDVGALWLRAPALSRHRAGDCKCKS